MSNTLSFFAVIVIAFSISTCSNPNDNDLPLHAPGLSTPVVTGLRVTGPSGPTEIAVWGVLSDPVAIIPFNSGGGHGGGLPTYLNFSTPYPNPHDGNASMKFSLPRDSRVSLWIVRARWIGTPNPDLTSFGGGTVPAPNNGAIRTLFHNIMLPAGYHVMTWDGRDDHGELAEGGFYRIYFQANEFTSWRDMLLYRSLEDIPNDLRSILIH
jgi:hypothetical protein